MHTSRARKKDSSDPQRRCALAGALGADDWPPHDFVVSVTSAQPHKRVGDLVTAWARARSHQSGRSVGLVLVGTFSDDTRPLTEPWLVGSPRTLCTLVRYVSERASNGSTKTRGAWS